MIELLFLILGMSLASLILAYFNANRTLWSIGLAATLLAFTILTELNPVWLVLSWLLLASGIFVLQHDRFRKNYLTKHVFNIFQAQTPAMSQTEQDALDAGDIGWEAELFSGQPDWDKLAQYKPTLSAEEQAFLDGPVKELCRLTDDWQITHELHRLPDELWDFIKKEQFLSMIIPKAHGGLGFSAQGHSAVIIKIASRSITVAVSVMVPNSLGPGQLLLEYGTEKQKAHYLPRLVSGEDIPCFALTAPEAGSDATGMVDNGIVCRQAFNGDSDVLGIRLNWSKRYITLGPVATLLGLAFKLYDPDRLLGDQKDIGITLALIPTDTEGVSIGRRHMPGAIPFQNGPNHGKDVFIPVDWIIGGPEYAGKGWMMLVECLSEGRGISLPALSVSAAKLSTHVTSAYSQVREQFHNPISKFEGIEEVIARIAGKTYLMEGARQLTLSMLDAKVIPSVATAIVKYHLTEMMREVINDAMDVHGGKAIMLGPSNYLMRIYQSIPISITVEGANILTRNMIIFGQGAMRCHPCLMDEIHAVNEEDQNQGLDNFDRTIGKHLSHILGSCARAFLLALTGGYLSERDKGKRIVARLSAALSFSVELILMLVGGQLKRRERISARLGDALSYLYLGSAAMAQFNNNQRPAEEKALYDWSITYSAYKAQEALWALAQNLPFIPRLIMKFVCFPFGRRYRLPLDTLDRKVAQTVLTNNPIRQNLISGIHFPEQEDQALNQLMRAFDLALESEPAKNKIHQARKAGKLPNEDIDSALSAGIITEAEATLIKQALEIRMQVVQVDDFAPEDYA